VGGTRRGRVAHWSLRGFYRTENTVEEALDDIS
jgi:hypothetical protein